MTVLAPAPGAAWRAALRQLLLVLLTNVPTASFGLSLAWVSMASGARGEESSAAVAGGAGATHAAAVLGVALSAAALRWGRKPPLAAASALFALCWGLKLLGGAPALLAARLFAGLAGAAAWTAAPLLGREVSNGAVKGAASAAPVLAHNFGFLLMYVAAASGLPNKVILWCCLGVSAVHCVAFLFVPESPAYLAARGDIKAARAVLAWLRAADVDSAAVAKELLALPPPDHAEQSPFAVIRELWQDRRRRRALVVGVVAVAGQESCGLLALLQFAEPVFAAAAGGGGEGATGAATHAMILGAVQLVASAIALYLVERVGRRPLTMWTALLCGAALVGGAALAWGGAGAGWLAAALAVAVAADSLGMQPAPYALLADMFHYRYRGCALALAMAAAAAGNAVEVGVFGAVAALGGMPAALALAAALTLLYAAFAVLVLPETRGMDPEEIYSILGPHTHGDPSVTASDVEKQPPPVAVANDIKSTNAIKDAKKENNEGLQKSEDATTVPKVFKSSYVGAIRNDKLQKANDATAVVDDVSETPILMAPEGNYTRPEISNTNEKNWDENVSQSRVLTVNSDNKLQQTQWTSM